MRDWVLPGVIVVVLITFAVALGYRQQERQSRLVSKCEAAKGTPIVDSRGVMIRCLHR